MIVPYSQLVENLSWEFLFLCTSMDISPLAQSHNLAVLWLLEDFKYTNIYYYTLHAFFVQKLERFRTIILPTENLLYVTP